MLSAMVSVAASIARSVVTDMLFVTDMLSSKVDGRGSCDVGRKVMDVTSPLALAPRGHPPSRDTILRGTLENLGILILVYVID
jgi:hypothetical protein